MLVFDFDGTLTDAEAEGGPFTDGCHRDLANILDTDIRTIREMAEARERTLDPNRDTFMINGQAVAPATVDPYLRIKPVAAHVCATLRPDIPPDIVQNLATGPLYRHNYRLTRNVPREGAGKLLGTLQKGARTFWIVTNSDTGAVQHKIAWMGHRYYLGDDPATSPNHLSDSMMRVVGKAKKYVNDPDWDGIVGPEMRIPGLDRPVLLRRRLYYEMLDRLRREAGVDWDGVTVVGDIFELDLALPLALDARIVLMANEHTPSYEIAYLRNHNRAHVVYNVSDLRECLELERY